MKRYFTNTITALTLLIGLVASAQAGTVALATAPLATSTTVAVKPNILFVLDNSGSMSWTFLPDVATNFQNDYGYYTGRCNGVYYDPNITYTPPIKADNTSYAAATFTAARDDGYDTSTPARNLNSEFIANRFVPDHANTDYITSGSYLQNSLGAYGAFYYQYNGTQTTKDYNNTASTFYTECNTSESTSTALFSKRKLASNETTLITVNSSLALPAPTATITVTGSSSTSVTSVVVNGTTITSGSAAGSTNDNTAASNLRAKITASGYSTTILNNTITITGPAGASGFTPTINKSGSDTYTTTAFVINSPPIISSITVNGVQLMASSAASAVLTSTTAANIAAKINQNGFTAVASSNNVVITGPASAANYTPVITASTGITFTVDIFPDTTPAKLTNFANWYSYYRTRMLMMKTSAGLAFGNLNDRYRVGLTQISSSNAPLVELGTFETTKRSDWYSKLYGVDVNGSTPLREALANAGRYYAGKLSSVADPAQYSCQQNFTILSTDGYWNGNAGFMLDGSTAVGNLDDTTPRPYYDGAVSTSTWTYTYTRDNYSKVKAGCGIGNGKLQTQTQEGTCTLGNSTGTCTPTSWSSRGGAMISGTCNAIAAPSPTTPVFESVSQNTTGGSSDSLADVAMYYYQTDLRTPALGNCGTAVSPATVGPLCDNNVFKGANDNNTQQHMTTFTLGLGASGKMNYSADYLKVGANADYSAVRLGSNASSTVCKWQTAGTTCNWPVPGANLVENIDDLWHAAVNGRGTYFSATNPDTLSSGLSSALSGVDARKGAASAAATSTLNPVSGNNSAYVASYTNNTWTGNLEARTINTATGVVSEAATWCVETLTVVSSCATTPVSQTIGDTTISNCETPVSGACTNGVIGYSGNLSSGTQYCKVQLASSCTGTMPAKVAATSDTRNIKTSNSTGTALINFDAAYATANPSYFNATKLAGLSQWASLTSDTVGPPALQGQRTRAVGANLLNYLRGQYGYEDGRNNGGPPDNQLFRNRTAVLGDALESQPAYIGAPVFNYPYPGYDSYKTMRASREGIVYMGANDGMMHAFHTKDEIAPTAPATCVVGGGTYCGGEEAWAYVPSMVIPNMWKLADFNYAALHVNLVNGSPITSDVCTANCTDSTNAVWKTILVGGLNGGGRGYYALDITTPSTPVLLWEITTTTGTGKIQDDDIGYSYGQPVITRLNDTNQTWVVVVSSGYNNVSPGDGKGYLYVLNASTGVIISKISTGVGNTTTPSGLAKIAGFNNEPQGNSVGYVYGGDLQGNVWRFNVNGTTTATIGTGDVMKFATLFSTAAGTAGTEQPITTTPVLGKIAGSRVVFIGTGKYLEIGDLSTTQQQTQYAIKDDDSGITFVNPRSQATLMVQQTMTTNATAGTRSIAASTTKPNFYTGRGWFVDFLDSGERVNIDSSLVQGVLLVPSIVPSNTACAPGGFGWLNFLDFQTGAAVTSSNVVSGKYDSTIVGVNVFYINGNPKVGVVTSINPTPNIDDDVLFPANAGNFTGKRSLWRELMQ